MAKSDNLTDFLKGLADKFRSVLGTADPLNPQDFEDKIQTVRDTAYSEGFADGGPTGITAKAGDVLSGKVFGSGGNAKATGTMPDNSGSTLTTATRSLSGGYLLYQPPSAGYMTTATKLRCAQANVASTVGLTAAKLVAGNTVLGVAGTGGTPYGCWLGTSNYPGSVPVAHTNMTKSGNGVVIPSAGTYLLGWFETRGSTINGSGLCFTRNGSAFGSGENFHVNVGGIPFFTASLSAGDVIKVSSNDRYADQLGGVIVKLT